MAFTYNVFSQYCYCALFKENRIGEDSITEISMYLFSLKFQCIWFCVKEGILLALLFSTD